MKPRKSPVFPLFVSVSLGIIASFFILLGHFSEHFSVGLSAEEIRTEETAEKAADNSTEVKEASFLRLRENEAGKSVALETSVSPYVSEDSTITVTLIGAIHLGEKAYYDSLNERFQDYEVVLYEVVAPEGTRPVKAGKSASVLGMIQEQLSSLLGLEFQLNEIDYSPENMVHADMTPEEFAGAMEERNDSFLKMYLRTVGYSMAIQNNPKLAQNSKPIPLGELLFGDNRRLTLKRMLAEEMGDMDTTLSPLEGKDGSAIVTDRNAKVVRILRDQLDEGKTNIAIFYGAAHLPDFAKQLEEDFELKAGEAEWLTAWDLEN